MPTTRIPFKPLILTLTKALNLMTYKGNETELFAVTKFCEFISQFYTSLD